MAVTPATVSERVLNYGGLHYFTSEGFRFWQPLTYMFIHAGFTHLFFNMWALLMFGYIIERSLGSKRFLFYYIVCGVGAAVIQMIVFAVMINHVASGMSHAEYAFVIDHGWELQQGAQFSVPVSWNQVAMTQLCSLINSTTIGASGAVFGILLAVGMLFPNATMYMMFVPYPIKAKWIVLGYGVLELCLGFGMPADGVAHFAHLGGMLFGLILLLYWKKQFKNRNGASI